MWFRCALVCIGRHAAGVTSGIQHRVTGGASLWLVIFENKQVPGCSASNNQETRAGVLNGGSKITESQ
jgi:hypothetical protein